MLPPSHKVAAAVSDREPTYTISDLAHEFALTTRAIRFYEDEGMLAPERRGRSRVYRERERVRLRLILRGKRLGLALAEIRELLDLYEVSRNERALLTVDGHDELVAIVNEAKRHGGSTQGGGGFLIYEYRHVLVPTPSGGVLYAGDYTRDREFQFEGDKRCVNRNKDSAGFHDLKRVFAWRNILPCYRLSGLAIRIHGDAPH